MKIVEIRPERSAFDGLHAAHPSRRANAIAPAETSIAAANTIVAAAGQAPPGKAWFVDNRTPPTISVITVPGLAPTTHGWIPPSNPPAASGRSTAAKTITIDALGDLVMMPTTAPATVTVICTSTTPIRAAGLPRA